MKLGTLHGIGIGPGDPELITLKGAKILSRARHVFVPRAPRGEESLAYSIAKPHIRADAEVVPVEFPLTSDQAELQRHWDDFVPKIETVLRQGNDVCYLTLGDTFLYSTYIYMVRALRRRLPNVKVLTIPGITSFNAAAALAEFPLGEGNGSVVVVPVSDDLRSVERALACSGTVVLMKVGKRLGQLLELLEKSGKMDRCVFVARAGLGRERIENDLRRLKAEPTETGHMSIILIDTSQEEH